jgi:hypothetical protein
MRLLEDATAALSVKRSLIHHRRVVRPYMPDKPTKVTAERVKNAPGGHETRRGRREP